MNQDQFKVPHHIMMSRLDDIHEYPFSFERVDPDLTRMIYDFK